MNELLPGIGWGGCLGEHPEFARFAAATPKLIEKLNEFSVWLSTTYPEGHTFRRISGQQDDESHKRLQDKTGATVTDAVAGLYSLSLYLRSLETSVIATAYVVKDFIRAATEAASERRLGLLLCDLRSIIERFAHVRFLVSEVESQLQSISAEQRQDFLNIMVTLESFARKILYGTRINWNSIVFKELRDVDLRKDVIWHKTQEKEDLGDYFSEDIGRKLSALEKHAPGSKASYYILCEFAHPNDGDLFASTAEYRRHVDRFGVVHITRALGRGMLSELTNANLGSILARVFIFIADDVIAVAKSAFEAWQKCATGLRVQLLDGLKEFVKVQKRHRYFVKSDPCICLSGRPIGKCCGRHLVWVR